MAYTGPKRKLTRLPGFDYRESGPYVVTICTHQRAHWFGTVRDGVVSPGPAGSMVIETWHEVSTRFPNSCLDAFVVMPNHMHAILSLPVHEISIPDGAPSLSTIIGWFKTMTTRRYTHGVRDRGWPPFDGRLWQSSFYDHIVRNERGLERHRRYVEANPARWHEDPDREPWEWWIDDPDDA